MDEKSPRLKMPSLYDEWYARIHKRPILEAPTTFKTDFPAIAAAQAPTAAPVTPQAPQTPTTPYTVPTPFRPPATPMTTPPTTVGDKWTDKLAAGLQDPAKMGLLGAGLSLMATPPRKVPYSTGELIGTAGLQGLQFFQQALKDKREQQRLDVATEERRADREERSLHYRAQERNWEEQRRIDAMNSEERNQYYKDIANIREMTAKSQEEDRESRIAARKALDSPIPEAWAIRHGLPPGTTIRQYKELDDTIRAEMKKNRRIVGPDDEGNFTVFDMDTEQIVATIDKAGKRTKAGSGTKPTNLQLQLSEARKQLEIDYKKKGRKDPPTPEEIAAKRRQMFPTGTQKDAGKSIRDQMLGGAPKGATNKVTMQDGSVLYFDKDGNLLE